MYIQISRLKCLVNGEEKLLDGLQRFRKHYHTIPFKRKPLSTVSPRNWSHLAFTHPPQKSRKRKKYRTIFQKKKIRKKPKNKKQKSATNIYKI